MGQKIQYFYTSNIGRCRSTNQDNFYCNGYTLHYQNQGTNGVCFGEAFCEDNPIFCVFDGMGGEEFGEIAAYIAAQTILNSDFSQGDEKSFRDYCLEANRRICDKINELGVYSMGTTAAMLRFENSGCGICNIGDSKIFLMSDGVLLQLSYDHVGIAPFGKKPPLNQNLGIPESEMHINPYITTGAFNRGDIYLICSDGLTDMISLDRISCILNENEGSKAAELLLCEALKNGGKDNITFILLYLTQEKRRGLLEGVRSWLKRN